MSAGGISGDVLDGGVPAGLNGEHFHAARYIPADALPGMG